MSAAKVIEQLVLGDCYHLYYKDENGTDRHVVLFALQPGEKRKHLFAMTITEFNKYKCDDYKIDPKAEVFMRTDDPGQVSKTERVYGNKLRISKFFTVSVDGKPVKIQIAGSAYTTCMNRVENILDDLKVCLRLNEGCCDSDAKLLVFEEYEVSKAEDEDVPTNTYHRFHSRDAKDPVTFITWEGDDNLELLNGEIDKFEELPDPLNTGVVAPVKPERKNCIIEFLKFVFPWWN